MSAQGRLTEKQARFVEEYLADLNATAAAARAGFSVRTAKTIGYGLLRKPQVAAAVQAAIRERSQRTGITADVVLGELLRIARTDLGGAFDEQGRLLPVREMPEDIRRAIAGLDVEELFEGRGADRAHVGFVRKVRFWDKPKALELLAKHLNLLGGAGDDAGVRGLGERLDRALARLEAKA
jgi:phage terminase small subunit